MLWRFSYKGSSRDQVDTGFNLALETNPWNVFGEDIGKVADFEDALEVFKFLCLIVNMSQECIAFLPQMFLGWTQEMIRRFKKSYHWDQWGFRWRDESFFPKARDISMIWGLTISCQLGYRSWHEIDGERNNRLSTSYDSRFEDKTVIGPW